MGHVTIEGSLTPCVELPRGDRRTVAVTDHVRRLVEYGYVTVVDGSLDDEPDVTTDETPTSEPVDDGPPVDHAPGPPTPPPGNASRDAWAEFLTSQEVAFPDGDESAGELWAGRDDLRIIWQQASGGR